jgi:hypothetical protein
VTRAENLDRILQQVIEGENLDVLLTGLTGEDQNLFYDLVAELRAGGDLDLDDLWQVDYLRRPPTMEEFLTDPYWLGNITVPTEDNEGVYPAWREILCRDFNLDSHLHNVVITGSLGCGKSWVSSSIMLYRLALCRLLRNPYGFLGLSQGSRIIFSLLSVTRAAVTETIFGDALNFMGSSAFFIEECGFKPDKKYSNLVVPLGNNVVLTAGSKGQHIIGRNVLGAALDEGNWRLEANPDMKAYKLYDEVRHRIKNRFQRVSGFLPAISLIASSARDEGSFTEQVIADIERLNDPRRERVYRLAAFVAKRHKLRLKPNWFKVAFGLKSAAPRVLTGWYREDGTVIEPGEDDPQGARIVLVPADYLDDFRRNPTSSLQSICGESTGGAFRFFPNFSVVEQAVTMGQAAGLKNPCKVDRIPLSDENDKEIWDADFLDHRLLVQRQLGRYLPLRDPGAPRFGHFDLATANQAGVVIGHVAGRKLIEGLYDPEKGGVFSQYRPIVDYDLALAIVPGERQPISIMKIMRLFLWLRDRCGYRFGLITCDSWETSLPTQLLKSWNFETDILSLDRTKEPYYTWRSGFTEQLIRLFHHPILMTEAERLLDLPKKVDHDPNNSKDVTDSAAAVYYNCLKHGLSGAGVTSAIPNLYGTQEPLEKPPIEMLVSAEPRPIHSFEA